MFPILEHPAMRPDAGFVELPAGLGFRASIGNSTKSYSNLHDSSLEFAQEKFDLLQIYPQEIIAWD